MVITDDFYDFCRHILFAGDLDSFFFDLVKLSNFSHEGMGILIRLESIVTRVYKRLLFV